MERNEMIEILMSKVNVSHDEAKAVLEECNGDLLEAIIHFERIGKVENNEVTTIIEVKEKNQEKKDDNRKNKESYGGIGEVIGRVFRFIGKVIKKGNENNFEIRKDNEKPIKISLTISLLLLIFLFIPSIVLLIGGLFCGYKYSLSGTDIKYDGVNDIFEEVSKSADSIKKDFKEGYEK